MPTGTDQLESESRTFQDDNGRVWAVYEHVRLRADADSTKLLVFESTDAIRCVRRYPSDWSQLSAAKLEALSWTV